MDQPRFGPTNQFFGKGEKMKMLVGITDEVKNASAKERGQNLICADRGKLMDIGDADGCMSCKKRYTCRAYEVEVDDLSKEEKAKVCRYAGVKFKIEKNERGVNVGTCPCPKDCESCRGDQANMNVCDRPTPVPVEKEGN